MKNSIEEKGIKLNDASHKNIKAFADSVLEGKINPKEVSSFINSKLIAISAVVKAFETSMNTHKELSGKALDSIPAMIDAIKILIKNGETHKERAEATEIIIKLSKIAERMNRENNSHQREQSRWWGKILLSMVVSTVVLVVTGGAVKKKFF